MQSYNNVTMLGNLTRDPELKYTAKGDAVANLGVALNHKYKDRNDEWQEDTTFVDVEAWGRTAESCGEHLQKGQRVFIVGRLKTDQWEDKDTGTKRSKLRVRAIRVHFLDAFGEAKAGKDSRKRDGDHFDGGSFFDQ